MGVVKDALLAIGLPDEVATNIEAGKDDIKPDDVVKQISDAVSNRLRDSPDFYNSIEVDKLKTTSAFKTILDEGYNKAIALHSKELKEAFGKEIDKDFTEEEKKLPNYYKKVAQRYAEQVGKIKMDDVAKGLQSENERLKNTLTEAEEKQQQALEAVKTQYLQKITTILETQAAQKALLPHAANIKFGLDGSLKEVIAKVNSKYAVIVGEDGEVELRNKENSSFKAKDDKGQEITYENALIAEIKNYKAWVEQKQQQQQQQQVKVQMDGSGQTSKISATGLTDEQIAELEKKHK